MPFEIAFSDGAIVEGLVQEVEAEAADLGVDPQDPGAFGALSSVGRAVRMLEAPDAGADAAHELAALLFQAVHFARAGRSLYLLETPTTRHLIEVTPSGEPRPPDRAGYLQFPQHLFWMGTEGPGAPESIDGVFWIASDAGERRAATLRMEEGARTAVHRIRCARRVPRDRRSVLRARLARSAGEGRWEEVLSSLDDPALGTDGG